MSRAKYMGFYRENVRLFDPELALNYPMMSDSFSDSEVPDKEKIISFLLNGGHVDLATSARATDIFTGEPIGLYSDTRTDGKYSWPTTLAYYVERYNLILPDDFVAHIVQSTQTD
ncbi:MAG: hypothetical protein IJF90_01910 [Synergistaceae bacterium]|nr:hypothetical protein [Synergistaceae bacterium]